MSLSRTNVRTGKGRNLGRKDQKVNSDLTEVWMINFQTAPEHYHHWKLSIAGAIAHLSMDVQEDATLVEGYKLKLNSYDLGVDIELADAVQRIRFEHPEVRVVVVTSLKPRIFCAGANIYMLGTSSHAFKVNFCKFTNETRCAIEDDSRHSGRRYVAALNGTASGGGYELAIACDEIYLVDDGNSAVSLPEVPLLGVLPGTGGLTRLVDKRKIRRDRADVFSTLAEGMKGKRAKEWGLIDDYFPTSKFQEAVANKVQNMID
jgi:benzoyl-CoA-dihydrodiol lyase